MKKILIVISLIALMLMGACKKAEDMQSYRAQRSFAPASEAPAEAPTLGLADKAQQISEDTSETRRYIARRHQLVVETAEGDLPGAWKSVNDFCEGMQCDILESRISNKTPDSPPSGSLVLRVVPQHLNRLLEYLGKVSRIVTHITESEDKTTVVIDVEAKIKNLTELRNRLRTMLMTRGGALKDVIEVERELARTQSELDSLVSTRKMLANETEKVAVTIEFQPKPSITETGVFAPVVSAWRAIGHVFASSVAVVMTFIVAVIPWLILVLAGVLYLPGLYRKIFKKRKK